jgi:hypothetical protein
MMTEEASNSQHPYTSPRPRNSILVLVVRHGEREDEAARRAYDEADNDDDGVPKRKTYKKANKQDRVDPKMTSLGYQLAAYAWYKIKMMLIHAGVMDGVTVFSSPLRRAVGTAMMLSVVNSYHTINVAMSQAEDTDQNDNIYTAPTAKESPPPQSSSSVTARTATSTTLKFTTPFPTQNDEDDDVETSPLSLTIPIVIHNGLADCTALVMRMGGCKNLVRTGFLHCAAVKSSPTTSNIRNSSNGHVQNQNNTEEDHETMANNPVMWEEIQKLSQTIQQTEIVPPPPLQPTTQFVDHDLEPVQFWQIGESVWTTMTPPIQWETSHKKTHGQTGIEYDKLHNTNHKDKKNPEKPTLVDEPPIDQAVRIALNTGCKVVLVSSHREEIRYLATERCHYRQRFHTPYCTVGQFEVLLDGPHGDRGNDNRNDSSSSSQAQCQPLQWILHGVCPPEDLDSRSISRMAFASESLSQMVRNDQRWTVSDLVVDIAWPVIERTMLSLCKARLILDESVTNNLICCVQSCTLNGARQRAPSPPGDEDEDDKKSDSKTVVVKFQVHHGHHSWLKFLRRLHDDDAFGNMDIELTDGQRKRVEVLLRPDKQPTLPCPPTTIVFDVLLD